LIVYSRLSALVVDDNGFARAITSQSLKRLGFGEVEDVGGGAEAVLALLDKRFDVLVTDWFMPDVSGAGLLQMLRDPRFGASTRIAVVMMTGYPSHETLTNALSLGVDDIVVKPFTPEQLDAAVARALAAAAARNNAVDASDDLVLL
jgi:two-component system chemotaxis response regulator CheY